MSKKTDEKNNNPNPDTAMPVKLGEVVIIRTLTFYYLGLVSGISELGGVVFLHLTDACVIIDSGDWHTALKTGKLQNFGKLDQETRISLSSVVEIAPWFNKLP